MHSFDIFDYMKNLYESSFKVVELTDWPWRVKNSMSNSVVAKFFTQFILGLLLLKLDYFQTFASI